MIGLSAGSGLIVNYLGKYGKQVLVSAGCCVCPAYNLATAFKTFRAQQPTLDECCLKWTKQRFIEPNAELLRATCPEAYRNCSEATTFDDLIIAHSKFTGCKDTEDYLLRYNPAHYVKNIQVPMLTLNSEDDFVSLRENIREDWFLGKDGNMGLLLRANRGAHVAFNESVFDFNTYIHRVCLDFLDSSRHVLRMK